MLMSSQDSGKDVGPTEGSRQKKQGPGVPLLLRPRTTKTLRKGSSDFKDQSQAKGAGPACSVFSATPSRASSAGGRGPEILRSPRELSAQAAENWPEKQKEPDKASPPFRLYQLYYSTF